MTNISGGPKPTFVEDTVLEALKLNEATRNWVATEVPDDTYGDIGDVVFIPGGPGGAPIGGGGKVLQVVRATDTETRTTTSTTLVDASLSVTITPQKSDSFIMLITSTMWQAQSTTDGANSGRISITDSANASLSGGELVRLGVANITGTSTRVIYGYATIFVYDSPATTSPVTYKTRFRSDSASVSFMLPNIVATGQMFAIEVSA
jgi:hypothetical protein